MNTKNIAEELLKTGDLTFRRNNRNYRGLLKLNYLMEWDCNSNIFDHPYSEESILLANSNKRNYKSPLHFALRLMAFQREIYSRIELLELCENTINKSIEKDDFQKLVKSLSSSWWNKYFDMFSKFPKVTQIWADWNDVLIVCKNEEEYLCWNWGTTA